MSLSHFLFSGKQKDKILILLIKKPRGRGHTISRLLSPEPVVDVVLSDNFKVVLFF